MAKSKNYDASSIEWLRGLEGIRRKPSMYIGTPDSNGVLHLFKEILGNSIDEAANGHGKHIAISIENNQITVFDNGRGIPNGPHPKHKGVDTLTILATEIHAGGKLSSDAGNYRTSTGTHGLGMSAVNALSSRFQVWSLNADNRPGMYTQTFEKGKPTSKVERAKPQDVPRVDKKTKWHKKGTIIQWTWDKSVFEKGSKLDVNALVEYVRQISYFVYGPNKGKNKQAPVKFTIHYKGKTLNVERPLETYVKNKIKDALKAKKQSPTIAHGPITSRGDVVDITLAWVDRFDHTMSSSANAVPTVQNGTHYKGATKAIYDAFKASNKRADFRLQDIIAGTIGCLNISIASPAFDSQVKTKLVTKEAEKLAYDAVLPIMKKWISSNKKSASAIVQRATQLAKANDNSRLLRELNKVLKGDGRGKSPLPDKLTISTTRKPEERELSVVEGDAAGGSAKMASDRRWQEILPLRGKITNVMRGDDSKLTGSMAIVDLLKAIGYKPNKPEGPLRVGSINVLSDADADGCLVGETVVFVRLDGVETTRTLAQLSEFYEATGGQSIEVLSYLTSPAMREERGVSDDTRLGYMLAHDIRVRVRRNTEYRIITESGAEIKCEQDHYIVTGTQPASHVPHTYNTRTGFYHIKAENLIAGMTMHNVTAGADETIESVTISNLEETKPYYCMTVPVTNNFVVQSTDGQQVVTGNCHISSLVLSVLWKTVPHLFEEGRIFLVDAPLYVYSTPKGKVFGDTLDELKSKVGKAFSSERVTRMKGLGEANPDELKLIAFDPDHRKLIKVTPPMAEAAVSDIMGSDGTVRKDLLGID